MDVLKSVGEFRNVRRAGTINFSKFLLRPADTSTFIFFRSQLLLKKKHKLADEIYMNAYDFLTARRCLLLS